MKPKDDFNRDELLRLTDALCAETISSKEHARLEKLLAESAAARQLYFEYIDFHLDLNRVASEDAEPIGCPILLHSPALASTTSPSSKTSSRIRNSYMSYAAVAVAAFAISWGVQLFLFSSQHPTSRIADRPESPPKESPRYVATFGGMSDCIWADSTSQRSEGWRLMPGELNLLQGAAEIRFDSGVILVIQGPTRLNIESGDAATLLKGQAVLRGDDISDGFSLHTPNSTLVDIGTEYAVSVDATGRSEVHVFDGMVIRHPKNSLGKNRSEKLVAGDAVSYSDRQARQVPLDADRFTRYVSSPAHGQHGTNDLLIADRFEYDTPALPDGVADLGSGWSQAWRCTKGKPGLNIGSLSQLHPDLSDQLGHGSLWQQDQGEIGRIATDPIRLDIDAVYYISMVFQRENDQQRKFLQLRMHQNSEWDDRRMLRMGIAHPQIAFLDLGHESVRTQLPLDDNRAYLLVAKIVAGRDRPDQAFLSIYSMDSLIDSEEPVNWTLNTQPVDCDAHLDDIWLLMRGEGKQWTDELRIGRTWRSVTSPYLKHQPL